MTDSPLSRVQAYLRDTEGMPGLDHEMIAGFIDGTGRTGRLLRSDLAALVAELVEKRGQVEFLSAEQDRWYERQDRYDTALDELRADRSRFRAEIDRMRPVVEACLRRDRAAEQMAEHVNHDHLVTECADFWIASSDYNAAEEAIDAAVHAYRTGAEK